MTLGEARELARSLFLETLPSLRVGPRLREVMRLAGEVMEFRGEVFPIPRARPIRVVAAGKAALEMADAAAQQLAGARFRGIVVAPGEPTQRLREYEYFRGGHPYPDDGSWRAAEAVLQFLRDCAPDDLVLFLISGGGSALLDKPLHSSVSLDDLRRFHQVLVTSGAAIEEINALRKHLSAVKGGRLAEQAAPATQVTLYVSDVPERLPSAVASGPTMPDETTVEDCIRVITKYALLEKLRGPVRDLLESGTIAETPKADHRCFAKSRYHCLLSNADAVATLERSARSNGLRTQVETGCDGWEFRRAADHLLGRLEKLRREHPGRPAALVSGGELGCPVTGDGPSIGMGGRNQAFALYCATRIAGKSVVVLSGGTDGIDGNSPAAGALADGSTAGRAAALGLEAQDFLRRSDSYHFFEKLGDTIQTGPTGTNVRDVRLLFAYA
ncbi:MAG: glycerate kinase type-2 family protein [Terriglobia bacterium]